MRLTFVALVTVSIAISSLAMAEAPSTQSIVDQGDRGMAHIGRGRGFTHLSAGRPAPVENGSPADYLASIKRYNEIIEQIRKQQQQARDAKAEADKVREEMRLAQTENQRSLADAQRRLESLSRDQSTNPEEVRAARTVLEKEIADRTRANSDYDQQLQRMSSNQEGLQKEIDAMENDVKSANASIEQQTSHLKVLGFSDDSVSAGSDGAAPGASGVPTSPTSAATAAPSTTETRSAPAGGDPRSAMRERPGYSPETRSTSREGNGSDNQSGDQPKSNASSGSGGSGSSSGSGSGGVPDMSKIAQAMQAANQQAEEQRKQAALAAQQAQQQQAALQSFCSLPINRSKPQCTGVTATAATLNAGSGVANGGAVRADTSNVIGSAPGGQQGVALNGVRYQSRDYSTALTREQVDRITLRMAQRVHDMAQPRQNIDPIIIPPLPSSQRGPAAER